MSKEAKYIAFPLFLIAGIPDNLSDMFDYGIYRFAMRFEFEMNAVYTQVVYGYYRGGLTPYLSNFIDGLVGDGFFTPDDDFNGFDGDSFSPINNEIDQLKEQGNHDTVFLNACIEYWRLKQALDSLNIQYGNLGNLIKKANGVEKDIDYYEQQNGTDALVMMNINIMFEYYHKDKSEYEIDLLRAYLGIKSILGKKEIVSTTKDFILTRMIGAKKKELLPWSLKQKPLKAIYDKYSKRYQMDKLLNELLSRGFITGKMYYKRRTYISTHYKTIDLPEKIHTLLLNNNNKIKIDKNIAIEKEAVAKLDELLKRK